MCHYNVLRCIRCKQLHRQGYELCENLEQGAICVDDSKLNDDSTKGPSTGGNVNRTTAIRGMGNDRKSSSSPIDLYYILPHKITYTDGCLDCP